jgi:hypothetical protein
MKRFPIGVAGLSPIRPDPALQPAAGFGSEGGVDAALLRRSSDDALAPWVSDAELLTDFTDFMGGPFRLRSGEPACPNPVFRERLRRWLWRTHAQSRRRDSREVH